jgi:hypothetical protein
VRSSSLRNVAATVAFALLLPACLLVDLNGLSGGSPGDEGGVEGGGIDGSDARPSSDAQEASGEDANDANVNGDRGVPDVTTTEGGGGEAGPPSYAETVLADGPIAYWRLDDTTTATAKDYSGNGHDGSYQGGVVLGVPGAIANDPDTAVQFNGSDAEMLANLPGSFDFAGNVPYSIEVWVKPASNPAGMGVIGTSVYEGVDAGGYMGWYVAYSSSGYLENWRANDGSGNPGPAAGVFSHVVATYDGTNLAIYVNGQPFATAASATTLVATGAPLTAGSVADWGSFTGVLDEIAIYDKALTLAQIATHYARGTGQ